MWCQEASFTVKRANFSSNAYDEFSPFYYDGGIVFCSNRPVSAMVEVVQDDKNMFNLYYSKNKKQDKWSIGKIFSEELLTRFNDGPVNFSNDGKTIYFSRNNVVEGKRKQVNTANNKIGIFTAGISDGKWVNIAPFKYNSSEYSLISPSVSKDGKTLYFSSDMPGGEGGFDIYCSQWINGEWQQPVNLGNVINTASDETHPFVGKSDKVFFASDGHKGLGGKDIFYSQKITGAWMQPVHLSAEINSEADDFGFFTSDDFQTGYFSSNRKRTDDIYWFQRNTVNFSNCREQEENSFCFLFYDENVEVNDSILSVYEWDFGEGKKKIGKQVEYCFPGPGKYSVVLRVLDHLTGDTINLPKPYDFELEEIRQPYINSNDVGFAGDTICFDALLTNLPDMQIKEYLWDFGDGFVKSGVMANQIFHEKGEYLVKLGLLGQTDSIGRTPKVCVYKTISINKKNNY